MGHLTQIVVLLEEDFSHLTISAPIQPVLIQSLISQKYTVNTFHNQYTVIDNNFLAISFPTADSQQHIKRIDIPI